MVSSLVGLTRSHRVVAAACYVSAVMVGTGKRAGTQEGYDLASRFHVGLHLFATLANCSLYTLL